MDIYDNAQASKIYQTDPRGLYAFDRDAMKGLDTTDRLLFERFGQGPKEALPFECIHHAIEYHARKQPNAIAAQQGEESITYKQLNDKANQLAHELKQQNIVAGNKVGVFTRRSISMLISMLACMKTGAAYVPLDATIAPKSQMNYILSQAEITVVLTSTACLEFIPTLDNGSVIAVDQFFKKQSPINRNLSHLPLRNAESGHRDQICFVLFTSGTTGKPNGVLVSHGNLCNILMTSPGNLGMKPGAKVSQILNIAFDMSAWEILGCLSNGATLVIREKSFEETLKQVDIVIATPSVLASIDINAIQPIKVAAVAGEPCPRTLADKWASFCSFFNACGPTETTIINTAQQHHPEKECLSIGTPTPNNTVYILDEELNPLPMGEVGEMWAGGDCVSKGYLVNDELTAKRYRPDPFLGNGAKMFGTRDLGRWTKEGQLEHLGRTDDQVKVRGFRVELDSISSLLETQADCKRAVTLKLNSRDLIAFVSPKTVDIDSARKQMSQNLPYYCMPTHIVALDSLPLTERGKINKRLLLDDVGNLIQAS